MPEISRFFGIVIRMRYNDHDPPHVHVFHAGAVARIAIDPPGFMSGDLSPRVLALVIEWTRLHREELLEDWRLMRERRPPNPIAPLE